MKKILSIALCSVLTASMLAGCGASKDSSSSTANSDSSSSTADKIGGSITFLTNRTDLVENGEMDKYISKFNEKYPDVKVNVESIKDYAGELATRMQTKEYGDVLMIPDAVPSKEFGKYFVSYGTVDDLKDKYREEYLYSKWFDGQVYGLAYLNNVQGIVYNKKVFTDAGITTLPKTPDEFLSALKSIKEKTKAVPYYTNTNSGWTLDQWEDHTYGTGTGDADYKNNKLPTDKNAFAPGSSHYVVSKLVYDIVNQGLCEKDPTTCDWEASKCMLNRGEIGCMVLGNWAIQQMRDADKNPDDIGYMPFPITVDGKQYATSGSDYCYGINKNSKNIDASKAFVQFMVDESGLCEASGGISLLKDAPMPKGLEDFANVSFVVNKPSTDETAGKLDQIQKDSGITLYDNGVRMSGVVDIARGASKETFDDYMKKLNDKWAGAVK